MPTQLLGLPLTKINHFAQSHYKLAPTTLRSDSRAAGNMGLAIAGGQCFIEVLCFYQTSVLADSLVLRNARHLQAPHRYR